MKNEFDIQMPNTQYLEGQTPSRCKQMNMFFSWFALLATGSEQFPRRTAHCSLLPLEALCEFESLIVITKIQGASGPSNNHHGRSLVIPCPIYNGGWMKLNGRKNEIWSDLMGGQACQQTFSKSITVRLNGAGHDSLVANHVIYLPLCIFLTIRGSKKIRICPVLLVKHAFTKIYPIYAVIEHVFLLMVVKSWLPKVAKFPSFRLNLALHQFLHQNILSFLLPVHHHVLNFSSAPISCGQTPIHHRWLFSHV